MLLAIDVGNTQTVMGVFDGADLKFHFRLSSERHRTQDESGVLLREILHDNGIAMDEISAVVLASVVPPLTAMYRDMVQLRFGKEPLVVGPGVKTGLPILYDNPKEVGADRVVNAVAGYERFRNEEGGPYGVIIVDFGTATTFDVVSDKGEYLGGAIAPGVNISTEALFMRASKLPRVDLELPSAAIGKTTVTSMQSGILFGYVALVDGMIERMCREIDYTPRILATGGIAHVVAGESTAIEAVEPFLTLDGLRIIYERNTRGRRA